MPHVAPAYTLYGTTCTAGQPCRGLTVMLMRSRPLQRLLTVLEMIIWVDRNILGRSFKRLGDFERILSGIEEPSAVHLVSNTCTVTGDWPKISGVRLYVNQEKTSNGYHDSYVVGRPASRVSFHANVTGDFLLSL